MLTGTPLDLTPFGPLLGGLGFAYWLLALGLVGLALWWPKRWPLKLTSAALLAAAFTAPMLRHVGTKNQQQDKAQARLAEAMALFAERCKTAGEKIHRTVDDVDGVVWMKWREKTSNADNYADQWKLNDPYGQDCGLEGCIAQLLRATAGVGPPARATAELPLQGYRFVETMDPRDGNRYRYIAALKPVAQTPHEIFVRHVEATGYGARPDGKYLALERRPIERFNARNGILWDDISTRGDREHWIAGGSLKVIDLLTNEVLAERVGYMIDRGQGSQAGFRSPWVFAVQNACPEFPHEPTDSRRGRTGNEMSDFVRRVLKPGKGEGT